MEKINFDKILKNKVNQAQIESYDYEALWQQVEPHIQPKKRRRGVLLFWWGCAFLLVLALVVYQNYEDSNNLHVDGTPLINGSSQPSLLNYPLITEQSESSVQDIDQALETNLESTTMDTLEGGQSESRKPSYLIHSESSSITSVSDLSPSLSKQQTNAVSVTLEEDQTPLREETVYDPSMVKTVLGTINNKQSNQNMVYKLPTHRQEIQANIVKEDCNLAYATYKTAPNPVVRAPLGIEAGIGYSQLWLADNTLYDSNIRGLDVFSAYTKLWIPLKSNWHLVTGIQFDQHWTQHQYTITFDSDSILLQNVLLQKEVANGKITTTFGDAMVPSSIQRNALRYQKYNLLNIPIGIGYMMHNRRLKSGFELGLTPNIYRRFSGWIETQGQEYNLNTDDNNLITTKISIGAYGRFILSYKVNTHWQINSAVYGQFSMSDIYRFSSISQKHHFMGIQLSNTYFF